MHRRHFVAGALATAAAAGVAQAQTSFALVTLGDSLTAGLGLAKAQAYPSVLEGLLQSRGYAVRVVNAGVSGDTVAAGLARVEWSVPKTANGVLVALGANDMLQGIEPARTRADLDALLGKLKQRNQKIAIAGIQAGLNWGPDYERDFNRIFPELAKKYSAPLYPFLLKDVALVTALNQPDMIHPNAAGARRIAENLAPFVAKAFPLPKAA